MPVPCLQTSSARHLGIGPEAGSLRLLCISSADAAAASESPSQQEMDALVLALRYGYGRREQRTTWYNMVPKAIKVQLDLEFTNAGLEPDYDNYVYEWRKSELFVVGG